MNTTRPTVTPKDSKSSHILIKAECAKEFHEYLKDKEIEVTPFEVAISKRVRVYIDKNGRKVTEREALDMAFDVNATSQELEVRISDWLTSAHEN